MLQNEESQLLRTLLAKAPPGEIAFNYHELQGFLFGLAITPADLLPSDWLPIIFSGDLGHLLQIKELMATVTRIHNRLCGAFQDHQLTFPYNTKGLTRREEERIHRWLYGLEEALNLREELWNPASFPHFPKNRREILYSALLTIQGLTTPEDTYAFFGAPGPGKRLQPKPGEEPGITPEEIKDMLFTSLPGAIDTLQKHAVTLEQKRQVKAAAVVFLAPQNQTKKKSKSWPSKGSVVQVDFRKRKRIH